jgi:arabinose-5-phosphate isomerase
MLRKLFDEQRRSLNRFFEQVDIDQAEKILNQLLLCKGAILLTGIGKSGLIAEKISATLVSTGTRSFFLSASDALHGDIGIVGPSDLVLFLSKSGESQELLDLLPFVQKRGAATIAVVSQLNSRLAKNCADSILLPVEKELCPHDLAPTTSTAVQLLFGDCLAVALMHAKNISIADFASNHPAGFLGKKITFRAADLMLKGNALPLCRLNDRLIDVLHILSMKRCGCLLVADEGEKLAGIFTDGDLRRAIETEGSAALQSTLSKLMNSFPKWISPEQLVREAIARMEEDPARLITVLPVLQEGRVVGLLRMHDILQAGLK